MWNFEEVENILAIASRIQYGTFVTLLLNDSFFPPDDSLCRAPLLTTQ